MLKKYIQTTPEIDEKLEAFYRLHLECPINLTAVKERDDFYIKHYLDSIYYFYNYGVPRTPLADIGSGGGFPGIVIALFYPQVEVTLVESIAKKCKFLESAVEFLHLKNVCIINSRAEKIKNKSYLTITARGVSPVGELLKNTYGLSRPGTQWIMYKGEKVLDELAEAAPFINREKLNVETVRIEEPFTRTYCVIDR